jgi:hypothetical protein
MSRQFQFSLRIPTSNLAVFVALAALCAGCTQKAPTQAMTLFGYTFVSDVADFSAGLVIDGHRNSARAADGTESELDEDISITCGTLKATIVNGRLTVDGKDRGQIKPGDRISFTKSGGLSVNGVGR